MVGGYIVIRSNQLPGTSSPQPTITPTGTASPTPTITPTGRPTPLLTSTLTPSPTATVTPPLGACDTANLALSLSQPQGAAGTLYYTIRLTNTGGHTCTLYGYPGVQLQANGQAMGSPATRNPSMPLTTISLQAGQAAKANLAVPNKDNYPAGSCSALSTGVAVYPPNTYSALTAPLAANWCPGFSISPVY